MPTSYDIVKIPLQGEELICSFNFKQPPVLWDKNGVGRQSHPYGQSTLALPSTFYLPGRCLIR
jgi:hypothetical protein